MLLKILLLSSDAIYLKYSLVEPTLAYQSLISVICATQSPVPQPHPKITTKPIQRILLATMDLRNYNQYKSILFAISYTYIPLLSNSIRESGTLRGTEVFHGGNLLSSLASFVFMWLFLLRVIPSVVSCRLGLYPPSCPVG